MRNRAGIVLVRERRWPQHLAEICALQSCRLVHYSTDYVFDGTQTHPIRKATSHNRSTIMVQENFLVSRPFWQQALKYSAEDELAFWPHPFQTKSFIHSVMKAAREGKPIKSVTDQEAVPTYAPDLAHWTVALLEKNASGLFHAVNDGNVNRYTWTTTILRYAHELKLLERLPPVEAVTTSFFNPTILRPAYSVLSNQKLTRFLGQPPGPGPTA